MIKAPRIQFEFAKSNASHSHLKILLDEFVEFRFPFNLKRISKKIIKEPIRRARPLYQSPLPSFLPTARITRAIVAKKAAAEIRKDGGREEEEEGGIRDPPPAAETDEMKTLS